MSKTTPNIRRGENASARRYGELLKLAAAKLTPEDGALLKEYVNTCFDQICRRDELIYSEALMDGMSIGYWVATVARGVEKIKV